MQKQRDEEERGVDTRKRLLREYWKYSVFSLDRFDPYSLSTIEDADGPAVAALAAAAGSPAPEVPDRAGGTEWGSPAPVPPAPPTTESNAHDDAASAIITAFCARTDVAIPEASYLGTLKYLARNSPAHHTMSWSLIVEYMSDLVSDDARARERQLDREDAHDEEEEMKYAAHHGIKRRKICGNRSQSVIATKLLFVDVICCAAFYCATDEMDALCQLYWKRVEADVEDGMLLYSSLCRLMLLTCRASSVEISLREQCHRSCCLVLWYALQLALVYRGEGKELPALGDEHLRGLVATMTNDHIAPILRKIGCPLLRLHDGLLRGPKKGSPLDDGVVCETVVQVCELSKTTGLLALLVRRLSDVTREVTSSNINTEHEDVRLMKACHNLYRATFSVFPEAFRVVFHEARDDCAAYVQNVAINYARMSSEVHQEHHVQAIIVRRQQHATADEKVKEEKDRVSEISAIRTRSSRV